MEIVQSVKDLEKELKSLKKKYDKLCKQIRKCRTEYQYDVMAEDIEDCRQDILELQLLIQDLRRKEMKEKELEEIYAD